MACESAEDGRWEEVMSHFFGGKDLPMSSEVSDRTRFPSMNLRKMKEEENSYLSKFFLRVKQSA